MVVKGVPEEGTVSEKTKFFVFSNPCVASEGQKPQPSHVFGDADCSVSCLVMLERISRFCYL